MEMQNSGQNKKPPREGGKFKDGFTCEG